MIPRLLAGRDRLSQVEKDDILASVLAGVSPPRSRVRWWMGFVPAVALTIAIVVLAPWRSTAPTSELAARGGGQPFAVFQPSCAGGCERGHKILFDLHGTSGYRYFAAFSKRPDGTVLWYFPDQGQDASVDLVTQPQDGVLDRSIVLGADHPAGVYRVHGVFSREPLTREMIRAAFDETTLSVGPGTQVVVHELVVR
ncbi:MAG: hypothetical protein JWP01_523 [Myxococcales bacterium]|nr:hypothetical protein [Myxococcales bacterium]